MARTCGIRIGPRRYELVVLDGSAKKHRIVAFQTGEFPQKFGELKNEFQVTGKNFRTGSEQAIYDVRLGKDMHVLVGCGLGGGSLINAGVTLRPDLGRLRKAGWPDAVVSDGLLLEGLKRAEAMLGVAPVPHPERFAKYAGMLRAAEASGRSLQLPPMTISLRVLTP